MTGNTGLTEKQNGARIVNVRPREAEAQMAEDTGLTGISGDDRIVNARQGRKQNWQEIPG